MPQIMGKAIFSHPNLLALLALLALAALISGCAVASALPVASSVGGALSSSALEIHNTTELRLQEKNFVVLKTNVVGESKGFALLGIITMFPAKLTTAMNRLYLRSEMQPQRPQALANLIMEKDSTYLVLFSIPRTSIRADVIEFTSSPAAEAPPRSPPEETRPKTGP